MNALFYFTGYLHPAHDRRRFVLTTPDGPHDRFERAKEMLLTTLPNFSNWHGQFICLTPEEIFKEL